MRKTLWTLAMLALAGTLAFAAGEGEAAASDGEIPTLTMFGIQQPFVLTLDSPDNEYTEFMEEKFGIKIEWIAVPSQERREKQNLLLASGGYPKVFWSGRFTNAEQMRYGGQGVLQPLNDLVDASPNILEAFELKPFFRPAVTTPDGNIYTLPAFGECYHCSVAQKLWINQTWLDTLGLAMPSTTDEFEAVLLAFKTDDPNGNGLADEIPLSGAVGTWHADVYNFFMGAFIYNDGQRRLFFNDAGMVDFAPNKPEWRDGLRYMRRLYEQGLVDPQAFTQNIDAARAVMNADTTVMGAYTAGHNRMFPRKDGLWQQYPAVPPLRGPEGVQWSGYFPPGVGDGVFAITDKASGIEARKAISMVNWAYTTEGTLYEVWGMPTSKDGVVNWRWAEEGELGLTGEPAWYWGAPHAADRTARTDSWSMEMIFWHNEMFMGWAANQDTSTLEGYEKYLVDESHKYIDFAPTEHVSKNLYFPEEKAQRIAQIESELQTYVKQSAAAFITGQKDLETEWNTYVNGFEGLGLSEYLTTLQEEIDATKARQGS